MCECHDSDAAHEVELAEQMAYWQRYFGGAVKAEVESQRFYRDEGIDTSDLDALRRLK